MQRISNSPQPSSPLTRAAQTTAHSVHFGMTPAEAKKLAEDYLAIGQAFGDVIKNNPDALKDIGSGLGGVGKGLGSFFDTAGDDVGSGLEGFTGKAGTGITKGLNKAMKNFSIPPNMYAIIAGTVAVPTVTLSGITYLFHRMRVGDQKRMKLSVAAQKDKDLRNAILETFKKSEKVIKLSGGVAAALATTVAIGGVGRILTKASADRKMLMSRSIVEVDIAKKKANEEIRAEEGKAAIHVKEISQKIEERSKGNVDKIVPDREYSFDEIKGQKQAIEQLKDLKLRILQSNRLQQLRHGIKERHFQDLLFIGPPGTGKTLSILALISEAKKHGLKIDANVININNIEPDLAEHEINSWRKRSEENAKQGILTLDFLDEFDSIMKNPKFKDSLQTYMDGVKARGNTIIIANTNNPDVLSGPILSRFGESVVFNSASQAVRYDILEAKLKEYKLRVPNQGAILKELSSTTDGFNGRDFKNAVKATRMRVESDILKDPSRPIVPGKELECSPDLLRAAINNMKFKVELTNSEAYSQKALLKKAKLNSEQLSA
jgi:AAA+ superfamily predicted ATPase